MTEREAIKILISSRDYLCDGNPTWRTEPIHDAVNMAVDALRKTENSSEKPNNSTRSKMEQAEDEPQTERSE